MKDKTCFFIGSRHAPYCIQESLTDTVETHITEYDVRIFTVGQYGAFDNLVVEVLKNLKKKYPYIELYLLAPYALNKKIDTPEGFNGIFYPEGLEKVPLHLAIVQANRYMVKSSDYLIAYQGIGNSRKIVEYAKTREKKGLIKLTLL